MAKMIEDPISARLRRVHEQHATRTDGALASYIPELTDADPDWFGICLVTADGAIYEVGDTRQEFTIQSISKPFTFGLILDELGSHEVRERIGVEPTGEAFNEISLDPATGMPLNPMINAGAITAAGMVVERHGERASELLLGTYGRFAARPLTVDETVFESERATAHRNRAIAHLLVGSGALRVDPELALNTYLRQCSVLVTARDLAVMAATLANGGINPVSGEQAASPMTITRMLTVMASCGMYDGAGQWLYEVGLPAKSGVAGGIIAVLPGRLGIAVFSPPLDDHGNSVRGVAVCRQLSAELGLHLARSGRSGQSAVRATHTLARVRSKRIRPEHEATLLQEHGDEVLVIEMQGELDFTAVELAVRQIFNAPARPRFGIVDLRRVTSVDDDAKPFLAELGDVLAARGGRLITSNTEHLPGPPGIGLGLLTFDDLDLALEWCEDELVGSHDESAKAVPLREHEALIGLDDAQIESLSAAMERRSISPETVVQRAGQPFDGLLLITSGSLSLFLGSDDGDRHRVATLAGGMMLGELSVAGGTAAFDAIADTDVEYMVLSVEAVTALRATDPDTWATLMTTLLGIAARRVDRLRGVMSALAD